MSSPQINNLIIAGCILSYTSVLLNGMDSTFLGKRSSRTMMNFICAVRRRRRKMKFEMKLFFFVEVSYLDSINWFYDFIRSYI